MKDSCTSREQEAAFRRDVGAIKQATNESAVDCGSKAAEEMAAALLRVSAEICQIESPSLAWLAFGVADAGLDERR